MPALRLRLPHPLVLLVGATALATVLTWILPAGAFERRADPVTGRSVVVANTYSRVDAAPVGPFAAVVAIARGFVEAADVVAVVLFVGGAWVVVDALGTLARLVGAIAARFRSRTWLAIPVVSSFFLAMGALENMQEEIIPLVPVLLLLGGRLGIDPVAVLGMSAGAAMIGSAFGPTNPFQAGIAMKLADLPPLVGGGVRLAMLGAASVVWVAWTMRYAARTRAVASATTGATVSGPVADVATGAPLASAHSAIAESPVSARDVVILLLMVLPMAAYVYGAMALGWGFDELSAGFLIGGIAAGLVGGLGVERTIDTYLDGMKGLLPAALMVGVARSISLVLEDGRVIDTILAALSAPLAGSPPALAALLTIPFHVVIHVVVSSVSGHAVLTMPVLVPLSDLLGVSRQMTVLAYQIGAGLTELLTPTNGSLMAILLAAGVSYQRWIRFALVGTGLAGLVGIAGLLVIR